MTDTYLNILEAASDPWALALISTVIAWGIVLCGAITFDPPSRHKSTPDFFDQITEFHDEL